ncbi:TonB-dependent receptor [Brevundimonas sp. GN22]
MVAKRILLTTTILCLGMAAPLAAQAMEASPPAAPAPQANDQGSLIFQPDFFAAYSPNTALDMVNRVPGFSVNDGDGARGFEGTVGNVLINGSRPASKNDTGSSILGRTLASRVERIELIRGGAPGIEMQGYAIVVNVILKTSASTEQIASFNTFIFDGGGQDLYGGSYQITHRKGDYTYGLFLSDSISTSDSNGEGPFTRTTPDGTVLRNENYWNDGYGGGRSIRGTVKGPLLGGTVDVTARYGVNDWHGENYYTSATSNREAVGVNDSKSGELGIVYTRPVTGKLTSETRMIHEFENVDALDRSNVTVDGVVSPEQLFTASGESSETILRSLLRYQHSDKLQFEAGGEVAYNMLEVEQAYSVGGTNVPLPSASIKVEELRGELFGKGTWRINPKWTMEAGLRLENSTISQSGDADHEQTFFFAKPRVQLTWNPRENTQLRMRFERTVGQLDFNDFAASAEFSNENVMGGNINLSPEQRWISEISFEQRFLKEGIFSIAYRHDAIGDVIDVIPLDGGLAAVGNIGDGTLDQLRVKLTLPTDKIGIRGGKFDFANSWNKTEVTDPTTGLTRPISNLRPSQAELSFEQNIPSWKLSWGVDYLPKITETSYQPDYVSGWMGRDYGQIWAEYKPVSSLSIRAQFNVWDSFRLERETYADRTTRAVAYTDVRDVSPRSFFQLRVRKTF